MSRHDDITSRAEDALRRRRLRLLASTLEIVLGDLVELEGIRATRKRLAHYLEQLENY